MKPTKAEIERDAACAALARVLEDQPLAQAPDNLLSIGRKLLDEGRRAIAERDASQAVVALLLRALRDTRAALCEHCADGDEAWRDDNDEWRHGWRHLIPEEKIYVCGAGFVHAALADAGKAGAK